MSTNISIGLAIFSVYTLFIVISWVRDKPKYKYVKESKIRKIITFIIQPFMDIFGNRKVTHFFHFCVFNSDELSTEKALDIDSELPRKREFSGRFSLFKNAIADLGWAKEAAIVEPYNFDEHWSLVFLDKDSEFCQECILIHQGQIKILVDGRIKFWGKDSLGKIIPLRLVNRISISQNKDILFI